MKRLLYGLVALGLLSGVAGQAKAEYIFTTLDVPGWTLTRAFDINDSGQIVGTYTAGATFHGYVLSGGSYTTLDPSGSTLTFAHGINDSGQIVGRYDAGGTTHGFLLSGDSYTTLDVPGSTFTSALGINDSGQIVGRYMAGGTDHGFLLSGDSYTSLDVPGSIGSYAIRINNSGQIVGYYKDAGGTDHGYLLSGGSYTTIDPPGSTSTDGALGINDSGQIVGFYTDAQGTTHAYLATPVPTFLITAASNAVSGTPFDVTVTALDGSGNIDTNYQGTVTFSATDADSGVVLPADYTFTTGDGGDNGVHTFPGGVTLVTVGDQTVTVTDTVSGLTGSATVTVGPGP